MKIVRNYLADSINNIVSKRIQKYSIFITDLRTSYIDYETIVVAKYSKKSNEILNKTALKWVNVAISNAKRNFNGIYQIINEQYLQNYFDEFCYILNIRYFWDNILNKF
jgi:hypothetical protein